MNISFVGLGKLGLPLATNFGKCGNNVLAIDKNEELIEMLQDVTPDSLDGEINLPWYEPRLKDNIRKAANNMKYTTSYELAYQTEATVILVNTPSVKKDGSFSNVYVEQALISVCNALVAGGKTYHRFILSSTVMPGSIKNTFIPLIENITGWDHHKDFTFSYVPDFVALGKVIHDFQNPDFLMIGHSDTRHTHVSPIVELYTSIMENDPHINLVNLPEAELAKVSLNAYLTTKISFANYLGILANKLDSDINVDNVTDAIGLDKRIGTKYFKAGAPYGGTCFPRDTWAFEKVSEKVGLSSKHMIANEFINDLLVSTLFKQLAESSPSDVGFIGIGFKPGTSVITEGLAVKLIRKLKYYSGNIHIYDNIPAAMVNLSDEFKDITFIRHDSCKSLLRSTSVVVYCNNDKYPTPPENLNVITIDPWRIT